MRAHARTKQTRSTQDGRRRRDQGDSTWAASAVSRVSLSCHRQPPLRSASFTVSAHCTTKYLEQRGARTVSCLLFLKTGAAFFLQRYSESPYVLS